MSYNHEIDAKYSSHKIIIKNNKEKRKHIFFDGENRVKSSSSWAIKFYAVLYTLKKKQSHMSKHNPFIQRP